MILTTSSCAQICQELGYSEHTLLSTSSMVRSISNNASQNSGFYDDQHSVHESDIDGQLEKVRQDAGILLEDERKPLISGHELRDIDD